MGHIVVIGSLNLDIVIKVPHIPVVGETVLSPATSFFCGGKGANQAVAAAKLGTKVQMIGRLGCDENGKKLYDGLLNAGVAVQGIEFDETIGSGTAYICVSERGDNAIVVSPGANSYLDRQQIDKYADLLDGAEFCVMQMEIPIDTVEYVLQLCREKQVKVILNPAPAYPISDEVLKELFLILPNESELDILCGSTGSIEDRAAALYGKGVKNVIVTLGEKGALLYNAEGVKSVPAVPVEVVDTTSAGDAFIGGLGTGLSEGYSMEESMEFASYVAGIAVSRPGAQSSLPDRQMVELYRKKVNA